MSPSRTWLLTPLVAVVVTLVGAIVLVKLQTDRTLWLAACDSRTFVGCELASVFFCAAAVVGRARLRAAAAFITADPLRVRLAETSTRCRYSGAIVADGVFSVAVGAALARVL